MIRSLSKQANNLAYINLNRRAIHQLKPVASHTNELKTLNSKTDCLDEINRTSLYLTSNFANSSFMANKNFWTYQLKSHTATQPNQERKVWCDELNASFHLQIDSIAHKLDQFDVKEKALLFRVLAISHTISPNKSSLQLLQTLESDLYDHIEKLDLVDWNNYDDGLNLFRTSRLHFISKTLNHSVELIHKTVSLSQPTNDWFTSNSLVNQTNTHWLESYSCKNDLMFSLHVLHKIKPFVSNRNYFNRALFANEYINQQLKDESSDTLLDKLVLQSYFNHYGYDKQFDRLVTEKFYDNLIETNLVRNLESINNSAMEKYFKIGRAHV